MRGRVPRGDEVRLSCKIENVLQPGSDVRGRTEIAIVAEDILYESIVVAKIRGRVNHRSVGGIFRQFGGAEGKSNDEIRIGLIDRRGGGDFHGRPSEIGGGERNSSRELCFGHLLTGEMIMNGYSQGSTTL